MLEEAHVTSCKASVYNAAECRKNIITRDRRASVRKQLQSGLKLRLAGEATSKRKTTDTFSNPT